jgi:hypothetical protein
MVKDQQRRSARRIDDGWCFQKLHDQKNPCFLLQLPLYLHMLFLWSSDNRDWNSVSFAFVTITLFCYVLIIVLGYQWLVMDLKTFVNELWLSLSMVTALSYEIFCFWMVFLSELLKWWYFVCDGWCSQLKEESATYCCMISLLIVCLLHTGCVAYLGAKEFINGFTSQ